jgi:hypothetical protein
MRSGFWGTLLLALLGSQAAPAADDPALVGIWYGFGEPDDPAIVYIDSYHEDGTYNAEFRKCEHGEVIWRQTASGKWSVKDRVLTMVSDTVNGMPERYENSYAMVSLSGTEFRARLADPDFLFIERRISKFEFPPCYIGA